MNTGLLTWRAEAVCCGYADHGSTLLHLHVNILTSACRPAKIERPQGKHILQCAEHFLTLPYWSCMIFACRLASIEQPVAQHVQQVLGDDRDVASTRAKLAFDHLSLLPWDELSSIAFWIVKKMEGFASGHAQMLMQTDLHLKVGNVCLVLKCTESLSTCKMKQPCSDGRERTSQQTHEQLIPRSTNFVGSAVCQVIWCIVLISHCTVFAYLDC